MRASLTLVLSLCAAELAYGQSPSPLDATPTPTQPAPTTAVSDAAALREAERDAEIKRLQHRVEELERSVGTSDEPHQTLVRRVNELERRRLTAGYDDGFYIAVPHFRLTLNSGAQARYAGVVRTRTTSTSTFQIAHAHLGVRLAFDEWLTLVTLLDFGAPFVSSGTFAGLRDLFVELRPTRWLSLRAGQFKVPFSRQRLLSSLSQTFVDRAVSTRALAFDRDVGLLIEGQFFRERWLVQFALMNGDTGGFLALNSNTDFAYTFRTVARPLGKLPPTESDRLQSRSPKFEVGAAVQYDLQRTPAVVGLDDLDKNGLIDNVEVVSFNAEATLQVRGFAIAAEYFLRHERPGFGQARRLLHAGHVQASMIIWRGLELAARFAYAEPHGFTQTRNPTPLSLLPAPATVLEASGLINYYIFDERLKVQGSYTFERDTPTDTELGRIALGHRFDVQLQAAF